MPNDALRKKNALLDWQNEKKYRERILKDPTASAKDKEYAKKRIEEADSFLKAIMDTEDFVTNCGGIPVDGIITTCGGEKPGELQEADGGEDPLPPMPKGRPRKLKDGTIKWGNLKFANEQEFEAYFMDNVLIDEGE